MTSADDARSSILETYRSAGTPLATVYLPSPSRFSDSDERFEIRKKNVVSALQSAGADADIVDVVAAAVGSLDHSDGQAHVFVVSSEGVLLDYQTPRVVTETVVRSGAVPTLLPLLGAMQTDERHLAVLLDRTGADVQLREGVGDPLQEFAVDGPDVRVHRSAPGGWSQKRFQQTAENAWENNAREVVDQVVDEFKDVDLIICGGDVRAVGFFTQHLPKRAEAIVVGGSRHSDPDAFLDGADTVLRTRSAERLVELNELFGTALANENGATGSNQVLDMLTQGRVDHLLVKDDTMDADRASSRFNFADNVHRPDDDSATEAPVADAAVALAVANGSHVTVVPATPGMKEGLGAILRF